MPAKPLGLPVDISLIEHFRLNCHMRASRARKMRKVIMMTVKSDTTFDGTWTNKLGLPACVQVEKKKEKRWKPRKPL
jgi:hypothetical protein